VGRRHGALAAETDVVVHAHGSVGASPSRALRAVYADTGTGTEEDDSDGDQAQAADNPRKASL
jgi:imidazolonepropionase-like amidohydrolase